MSAAEIMIEVAWWSEDIAAAAAARLAQMELRWARLSRASGDRKTMRVQALAFAGDFKALRRALVAAEQRRGVPA